MRPELTPAWAMVWSSWVKREALSERWVLPEPKRSPEGVACIEGDNLVDTNACADYFHAAWDPILLPTEKMTVLSHVRMSENGGGCLYDVWGLAWVEE